MRILIKNGSVYRKGIFEKIDCLIVDGYLSFSSENVEADAVIDATNLHILPGLIDPHVHLREPGFSYKETIKTGTLAAAKGGYTTIFAMPNLQPPIDCVENILKEKEMINNDACIKVIPYACITKSQIGNELVDFDALSEHTFLFSDDGKGVQTGELMYEAMRKVKEVNGMIVAHCEDESELHGGYVHEGEWAKENGHLGINSASEYKQVIRDLQLSLDTGCQYHVCHVSTKESVEAIRKYKAMGAHVTAEVTPHHLLLCDEDIKSDDGRYKMNPPLRSKEDQKALLIGLQDGTIDVIATDHAPHSDEEKSKGLRGSAMGVVGLETSFPLLYTHLVKKNKISLNKLVECMSSKCADIFGIDGGYLDENEIANVTIIDLNKKERIQGVDFISMGKSTPFNDWYVNGVVMYTIYNGKIVYRKDK